MNRNRLIKIQIIFILLITLTFIVEPALAISNQKQAAQTLTAEQFKQWIIESEDSYWTVEEKALVYQVLSVSLTALEDAGYDGQELMGGYHFRRQQGEFVDGIDGRIALVRHNKQEIILADTAFLRLQGFYIYHELGHVVDKRLERQPSSRFHEIVGSKGKTGSQKTADGFWLNEHARLDQGEATADAFALWVVLRYTENYKPVFWHTPATVSYEDIVAALDLALDHG